MKGVVGGRARGWWLELSRRMSAMRRPGRRAVQTRNESKGFYGVCSMRVRRPQRRSTLDGKGLPTPVCWPHLRSLTLLEFHLYIAKILNKEYVIYVCCLKRTFGTLMGEKEEWESRNENSSWGAGHSRGGCAAHFWQHIQDLLRSSQTEPSTVHREWAWSPPAAKEMLAFDGCWAEGESVPPLMWSLVNHVPEQAPLPGTIRRRNLRVGWERMGR